MVNFAVAFYQSPYNNKTDFKCSYYIYTPMDTCYEISLMKRSATKWSRRQFEDHYKHINDHHTDNNKPKYNDVQIMITRKQRVIAKVFDIRSVSHEAWKHQSMNEPYHLMLVALLMVEIEVEFWRPLEIILLALGQTRNHEYRISPLQIVIHPL